MERRGRTWAVSLTLYTFSITPAVRTAANAGDRFHSFFAALDNTKNSSLLYLSSVGPGAVKREDVPKAKREAKKEIPFEGPSSGEEEVSGAEDG